MEPAVSRGPGGGVRVGGWDLCEGGPGAGQGSSSGGHRGHERRDQRGLGPDVWVPGIHGIVDGRVPGFEGQGAG